ncbi:uncharacterized protein KGF55_005320 [Candida pseudojiufengensis]|uniref:uncharacterized protein n=1 Tax=Candida pseudojiufengensis TaxID=497109 RepID=UPI00222434A1|nr:uncharacterized protein KGF55_005320 [Candida pseudojiufengensis]KAI5959492.1 hypothetical protein KGF55_005320 [Candida pseudojiufengensis]
MNRYGLISDTSIRSFGSKVPRNFIIHRFQSNSSSSASNSTTNPTTTQLIKKTPIIDKNSIYVISIPITTQRSFIYCNHRPDLLNKTQYKRIPFIIKFETKIINLATKAWNKLITSKSKINIKITEFIMKLLSTIPYQENCLRSFPSKDAMIREINEESLHLIKPIEKEENEETTEDGNEKPKPVKDTIVLQSDITNLNIPNDQLKPIPLYHPKLQNPTTILNELYKFRKDNEEIHKKNAWLCGIAIPLCLPLALIPVLPNVPGFYFTYRLYCNYKALMGIKHLDYLLETNIPQQDYYPTTQETVNKTKHINFKSIEEIDKIYRFYNPEIELNLNNDINEEVIINPEIIDGLVKEFDLETSLKDELLKALKQEKKRLKKEHKVDDQVN